MQYWEHGWMGVCIVFTVSDRARQADGLVAWRTSGRWVDLSSPVLGDRYLLYYLYYYSPIYVLPPLSTSLRRGISTKPEVLYACQQYWYVSDNGSNLRLRWFTAMTAHATWRGYLFVWGSPIMSCRWVWRGFNCMSCQGRKMSVVSSISTPRPFVDQPCQARYTSHPHQPRQLSLSHTRYIYTLLTKVFMIDSYLRSSLPWAH